MLSAILLFCAARQEDGLPRRRGSGYVPPRPTRGDGRGDQDTVGGPGSAAVPDAQQAIQGTRALWGAGPAVWPDLQGRWAAELQADLNGERWRLASLAFFSLLAVPSPCSGLCVRVLDTTRGRNFRIPPRSSHSSRDWMRSGREDWSPLAVSAAVINDGQKRALVGGCTANRQM